MSRPRSQRTIFALLLGTLALIAYGSLYPFNLRPGADAIGIWRAFGELSWARAGRGDRIANVLLYVPLGFCLFLSLDARVRRHAAILLSIAGGMALSYSVEVAQVFIAQRVSSYWDVVFNAVGSILGAAAGVTWYEMSGRLRGSQSGSRTTDRAALLVVILWLVWRLWPFVPQISIGRLKGAFQPLADPFFSPAATFHYLIWWTLLAQIVFALVGGQRGVEALLALIAIVLAGALGITDHGFVASELLALVFLLPTLLVFNRLTPAPRHWLLLCVFIALFVYESFAPFAFAGRAGRFDMWPFMRWIDSDFPIDWHWLARRACYFAAIAWMLKEAGFSLRFVSMAVPLAILVVEVVRLWIPGQAGSITEPALALAIAWLVRGLANTRSATLQRARSR